MHVKTKFTVFILSILGLGIGNHALAHGGHSHSSPSAPSAPSVTRLVLPKASTSQTDGVSQAKAGVLDKKVNLTFSSEFVATSNLSPIANTHIFTEKGEDQAHLMNSVYASFFTSPNFSLYLNPRFDLYVFSETGNTVRLENPRVGGTWSDVWLNSGVSISYVTADLELPLSSVWKDRGLLAAPGVFVRSEILRQKTGRFGFGFDVLSRLFLYGQPSDPLAPKDNPDVQGYLGIWSQYQVSLKLKLRAAYEFNGYYFRNRSDSTFASDLMDFRLSGTWTPLPALSLTPYFLIYTGGRTIPDSSTYGLEAALSTWL